MPRRKIIPNKIYVELWVSDKADKKYKAVFKRNKKVFDEVHFGAKGMDDYTTHGDEQRKDNFQSRFQKLITKEKYNPYSPMTLANMVLWNKKTLKSSWNDYKRRFKFK